MLTLEPSNDGTWVAVDGGVTSTAAYRLCTNYRDHAVCNWALAANDPDSLCRACALTQTIPSLSLEETRLAWGKLESAKRRLIYSILSLRLPLSSRWQDPERGLQFKFLQDSTAPNGDLSRVLTGHDNGVITINIAEADEVYRETQRQRHNEPYRTLLGHFRHEVGHYYWDQLVANGSRLETFRDLFGDERHDYSLALKKHYDEGAPSDWEAHFISAYASTHPWEDWAECWAHVMHMVDALDTALAVGLSVKPRRRDEPVLPIAATRPQDRVDDFDQLWREWTSLTYVLNNLTRGLGLPDAYPFVASDRVIEKLRFVSNTMTQGG